jgi:hypothetical protein
MNRLTNLALAVAAVALCALLWHLTETDTECKDRGGVLLRDLTGYVCVAAARVAP